MVMFIKSPFEDGDTAACIRDLIFFFFFLHLIGAGWLLVESSQVSDPLPSCCLSSRGRATAGLLVPSRLGQAHLLEVPSTERNLCHHQGRQGLVRYR